MIDFFKGTVTQKDWGIVGGIVGAAVVLVLGYWFLPLPLLNGAQQANLEEVIASDEAVITQLTKARETQKNIESLRNEAAKMQELATQFEERLPDSREIPALLKQFEGLATEIGLWRELAMLPRIPDTHKETIPYSVVVKGNFHQIVSFINRLERSQRYFKVSELNIGKEESGVAQATFTLSTFRFIQASETAKPGEPAKQAESKKS